MTSRFIYLDNAATTRMSKVAIDAMLPYLDGVCGNPSSIHPARWRSVRALIAMSGGVDSSLAAKEMMERGYECIGCTMRLYHNEDIGRERSRTCCSLDDVEDARSVAYALGMPFYVFDFFDAFREKVICKFVRSYEAGLTPNPCIDCNRYMKFDKFWGSIRGPSAIRWDSAKGWDFHFRSRCMSPAWM